MYVYGVNPLKEILKNNSSIILEVYIEDKKLPQFIDDFKKNNIKYFKYKNFEEFKDTNTQGIIFKIKNLNFYNTNTLIENLKNKQNSRIIILDQIYDPQNFGSIIRNAVAFEVDAILFSEIKNSPFNSTVIKSSAGTWINIKLCKTNSISNSINLLKKNEYWIISTSLNGKNEICDLNNFKNNKLAIIFGNENKGVKQLIQKNSDLNININISKNVNSLNVSATSAILLHELFKQNKK